MVSNKKTPAELGRGLGGLFFAYVTGYMMPQYRTGRQGFNKSPQPLAVGLGLFLLGGVLPVDIDIAAVCIASAALAGVYFLFARAMGCKGDDIISVRAGA